MKKIVIGCFLLFVTVLVTLYSCSKKDAYWDSVSSQSNTLSVSDARSWYENQFAGDIADIKSIEGSGKARLVSYARGVFAGVPDWNHYQKYRNNSNAMAVQLDYPDTGRGYRGFRDLVVVKNNRKQTFNAYVQLEIFSKSYLKEQIKKKGDLPDIRSYSDPATFTGSVLLFSVDNEFIRGARYQNGQVVARIFPKNGISGMVSSISNSMHASKTYVAFNGGASVADIQKDNASKSVAFNKSSQSISYEEPSVRTASSANGDSNDSNDSHDSFDDTHDLGDVTVISTKPNTNHDSDGFDSGDSYPTGSDPTPTNPTTGGGGGGGSSSWSSSNNNAKMCGSYNWGTVGGAWYTQMYKVGLSLVNTDGRLLTYTFDQPVCIMFGKYKVATTKQANDTWNQAWNQAVDKVLSDANTKNIIGDFQVRANLTKYIQDYLKLNYPGASSFNPSSCSGDIPHSTAAYCN